MKNTNEYVTLVDSDGIAIGQSEKLEAHQRALLHSAFSVFILRQTHGGIETLLQQRSATKYHCAGLWTNTCCGHPRPHEAVHAGAERRLAEEMGMQIALHHCGNFCYRAVFDNGLTENEFDHVFVGWFNNRPFTPDADEISAYHWIEINALQNQVAQQAKNYTPWLLPACDIVMAYLQRHSIHRGNPIR